MEKHSLMEMARKAGVFNVIELSSSTCYQDCDTAAVEKFYNRVLEHVAEEFDKRGRHIDGGWSEGWYKPSEPGEIIRGMINNRVQ